MRIARAALETPAVRTKVGIGSFSASKGILTLEYPGG